MKALLGALVLVLAAGCGSSTAKPDTRPHVTIDPTVGTKQQRDTIVNGSKAATELRAAVQAYADAYLTGQSDLSYSMMSGRCQARFTKVQWDNIVAEAKATYGSRLPLESFSAEIAGNLARATYTFSVSAINQDAEPWVRERGHWREDDC